MLVMSRAAQIIWIAATLFAGEALFSVVELNWTSLQGDASNAIFFMSFVWALGAMYIVCKKGNLLGGYGRALTRRFANVSPAHWMLSCIVIGSVLRIAWITVFPAPFRSDYATYFSLAQNLAERGVYQVNNSGYGYWPPGYPLFLAACVMIFGPQKLAVILANLFLFAGSIFVTFRLAQLVFNESAARLATLLLVCWPSDITSAGLASKERLVLLLLPLAVLGFLAAAECVSARQRWYSRFGTGVCFGLCSLTQPSLLLFPSVLGLYTFFDQNKRENWLRKFAPVVIGMVLSIGPWSLRNYLLFNQLVVISTNGGDVFYRANNELATGGYTTAGATSLDGLDEIQRNKVGFSLGLRWIRSNPVAFLSLAVKKQILFLGDDGHGVFETLKRGLGITDRRYLFFKGIANVYWLAIWVIILAALANYLKSASEKNRPPLILILACFYLLFIHSIFESGGRYHQPLTIFFAVLASMICTGNIDSREKI